MDRLEQEEEDDSAMAALSPVGSLMFIEVERRIDVFVFRCCFSPSVYDARRLVIHGHVKLNGKVVCLIILYIFKITFTDFHLASKCRYKASSRRYGIG